MTTSLPAALDRLVSRGVLTTEQADAVLAEVGGTAVARPGRRSLSPAAELAGYLGAALTVVALGFLLEEPWSEAPAGVRALLLAVLTLVLAGAGWALRDAERADAVRGRLTSALWAGAVLAAGWAAVASFGDDGSDPAVMIACGGAALAVALPLYLLSRAALQLVALVGAGLVVLGGVASLADLGAVPGGLLFTAAGLAVLALGTVRLLEPDALAVAGGAAIAVVAIQVAAGEDGTRGVLLLAAVALCIGLFVLATRTGAFVAGVATIGLASVVPQALHHFVGDGASVPLLLLVTGLALLGGAALTNRIRRDDD